MHYSVVKPLYNGNIFIVSGFSGIMSQHLEVLVNKDFEKLLVGFDIVQINDAFGVTE